MVLKCKYIGYEILCVLSLIVVYETAVADMPPDEESSQVTKDKNNATRSFVDKLLQAMDPRIKPENENGMAVQVLCGFYIVSFSSINEISMDYKMTILFREIWIDSRLVYDANTGPPVVSLSGQAIQQMWVPDIYFPNEKEAKFHTITVPNTLLKIYPNGTVIYSVRVTLQLSCPMNLAAFPMDKQTCAIKLESFAYETHEMELLWMDEAVEVDDNLELPQFDFGEITTSSCLKTYKTTGMFSCLRADFTLYRQFGFFLLQTYIPSILIVILSWVSFWINMDAVPARISLGVTTVLTMTTQLSGSTSSIPKVSYPKAIDVWLSVCMIFVFASIIEYAFVNALARQYKKRRITHTEETKMTDGEDDTTNAVSSGMVSFSTLRNWGKCSHRNTARSIDKMSRIMFPASFMLFNFIYWPVYARDMTL